MKDPWTLESIAKDFGWTDTAEYLDFKTQLLLAEPSLQASFDRVEIGFHGGLAKLKLWTNDILVKIKWNVTTEAWKDIRNLSLVWSEHKLKSKLDPNYEQKLQEINKEANKILKPINEKLNTLSAFLDFLRKSENSGSNFEEVKKQI